MVTVCVTGGEKDRVGGERGEGVREREAGHYCAWMKTKSNE